MKENTYRIIKIGRKALYEFIYEKFIEEQGLYMDVDATEVMNSFDIDYVSGNFIFAAHQAEDAQGNLLPFPAELDLKKLLVRLEDTTETMFTANRYRDYTREELLDLQEGRQEA